MPTKSRYESYKVFFDGLALLHTVANQQTLFLAYLLSDMDNDNMVHLTVYKKQKIMKEIGSKSKKPLIMANQHLTSLARHGLVKSQGGGTFMVNPQFASKFEDFKYKRDEKTRLYVTMIGEVDGTVTIEAGVKKEHE